MPGRAARPRSRPRPAHAIDSRKIGLTILAWIASFAVAFLLGYGIALAAI
ncbi:hypothetical protein [Halopenitus sp. POP-27]|nr:hypothetical protein [Halopenitus sp. POP-27]